MDGLKDVVVCIETGSVDRRGSGPGKFVVEGTGRIEVDKEDVIVL